MNNSKYFYNGEEVRFIHTNNDTAWIVLKNGDDLLVPAIDVCMQGKFEHLMDLPVDTKVLVKDLFDEDWEKRHFSHVSDNGKYVVCFAGGKTSFTTKSNDVTEWLLCEVYEE